MTEMELKLIKIDTRYYYTKAKGLGQKTTHNGRIFYDKFERVDFDAYFSSHASPFSQRNYCRALPYIARQ